MDESDLKKYFHDRECDYYHEYPVAYGLVEWKGKSVVMIGGDCGSLAVYALMRGASRVYLFEKEEHLRKKFVDEVCRDFRICDRATMLGEWTGADTPQADILLVDCEGCETLLLGNPVHTGYREWCIAVHEWTEKKEELLSLLYGHVLTYVTPDFKEIVVCNVTPRTTSSGTPST